MSLQDDFVSNLKIFRKRENLTQEKLAELCNTDTAYIGQIETKRRFPSVSFIEKIASVLKCEPYMLFEPQNREINKQNLSTTDLKKEIIKEVEKSLDKLLGK